MQCPERHRVRTVHFQRGRDFSLHNALDRQLHADQQSHQLSPVSCEVYRWILCQRGGQRGNMHAVCAREIQIQHRRTVFQVRRLSEHDLQRLGCQPVHPLFSWIRERTGIGQMLFSRRRGVIPCQHPIQLP